MNELHPTPERKRVGKPAQHGGYVGCVKIFSR